MDIKELKILLKLMRKGLIESEPKVAHHQRNPMNQINLIS